MEDGEESEVFCIAAPMVRYSKYPFRKLIRRYGVDLAFTPMIIASSFAQSEKCRQNEFTTGPDDQPLIVQFAANNATDFVNAAEYVVGGGWAGVEAGDVEAFSWAMAEGYGAHLCDNAELLADVVGSARRRLGDRLSVSAKLRVHDDLRQSVAVARAAEAAGVHFLSVHGRTKRQRKQPVSLEAIRLVKQSVSVPVYANGDVFSLADARRIVRATGVDGVMSARGLLNNPSLFSGASVTTSECIRDWVQIAMETGTQFAQFHNHLMFMMENILPRSERRIFNRLLSAPAVMDYLSSRFDISFTPSV